MIYLLNCIPISRTAIKVRPVTQVRARQLIFQTQRSHSSTRTRSISLVRSGCRRTKIGKRQFRTDFHRTLQRRGQSKREAGGRFRFCNQRAKSSKWPTTLCFCTIARIAALYLSMIRNIWRDIPSNLLPMFGNRINSRFFFLFVLWLY